jgi:mycothiol system anti-sigma-R factor
MSCGQPHEVPCTTVLSLLYVYIDNEIDEVGRIQVTTHLAECSPCEGEFAAQISIHARIQRSCRVTDQAPVTLRSQIIAHIRQGIPPVQ